MKAGAIFLIDEISLADDSVLERLNSVLEPERTLVLAEKGAGDGALNQVEQIVAKDEFRVVATMNPGGDYGKKEVKYIVVGVGLAALVHFAKYSMPLLSTDKAIFTKYFPNLGREKTHHNVVKNISSTKYCIALQVCTFFYSCHQL